MPGFALGAGLGAAGTKTLHVHVLQPLPLGTHFSCLSENLCAGTACSIANVVNITKEVKGLTNTDLCLV